MSVEENISQKNEELFNQILKELSHEVLRNENLVEIADRLNSLCEEGFQHQHSDVATFILQYKGKIDETSMFLAENFKHIKSIVQKDSKYQDAKAKIQYLSDHVNLECIHFQSIEQTEKNVKKLDDNIKQAEQAIKEIHTQAQKVEKQIENQQNQHTIILGIFASIVLAFVGGLTFSTSVLSHMHEVSIHRLVFVICCIAFLVFNIIFALFDFVLKISGKASSRLLIFIVNMCIILIIGIDVWHYFCGSIGSVDFFIFLLILFVGIMVGIFGSLLYRYFKK